MLILIIRVRVRNAIDAVWTEYTDIIKVKLHFGETE